MNQDYELYYLSDVLYGALKNKNARIGEDLFLIWDDTHKKVGITTKLNDSASTIGHLSEEDGKKYIPYLMKKWSNIYEACVVSINASQQDISKRIMVAVRIKNKPQEKISRRKK